MVRARRSGTQELRTRFPPPSDNDSNDSTDSTDSNASSSTVVEVKEMRQCWRSFIQNMMKYLFPIRTGGCVFEVTSRTP